MASAASLKDIDEQFLQCCICMEQLKDPKMLPCLHRYCRDCLKNVFKEAKEIECPTCREKHTLPDGGIDGLKTDFNTKNIIEFIQLQSSVKVDPLRTCIHCRKRLEASAFCFKCNDFLCHGCHEIHASSMMVKDHHPHIFSLSEAEARNLTIQKLSSLKEAPRCHKHPEKFSELCCMTCSNMPICTACVYGVHQDHNLKEVKSLAGIERKKLTGKIADLMQYKEKIYKVQEETRRAKDNLDHSVDVERKKLQEQLNDEVEIFRTEIHIIDEKLKKKQADLTEKLGKKTSLRKEELEEEMRQAREKYERVCKEDREEADAEFEKLQQENEREKKQLQEELDVTNNSIKELLASVKTQEEENTKKIKELSENFAVIVKQFETVTMTASSILAAKHDWTDVQCIPDICRAIDPLIEEVKRELPELETLSNITVKGFPLVVGRKQNVQISENKESTVDIQGIGKGWYINGIASSSNGGIVITGEVSDKQSHITVINSTGEQLRQDSFQTSDGYSRRYCNIISQSKVATVSQNNEIGIYEITDGAYRKLTLTEAVNSWQTGQETACVTVDHFTNHIIVGCNPVKYVYVFNDQLKYIQTLEVPGMIRNIFSTALRGDSLLICDNYGCNAYAISMKKTGCELMYQFEKPVMGEHNWQPISVCTDRNAFVYVLWGAVISGKTRSMVAQYSCDGKQLLTTRLLDDKYYCECITTSNTKEGEKLVMATYRTGQLIIYGLE